MPGVLEIVLREAVAVEGVKQLDSLLCGAIGEMVDGEDGLGAGLDVELEQGVRDERGLVHAGEHLDGGELRATPQDLRVQGHEAPFAAFLPLSAALALSGNAAS